jgi:hypothetical protein
MTAIVFPLSDPLAAYRQAALDIRTLRRKGIRCHLEQRQGLAGPFLQIVEDLPTRPRSKRDKIRGDYRTPCAAAATSAA